MSVDEASTVFADDLSATLFMKKAKASSDEMRAGYGREDIGPLVRGKYAARYAKATSVVVIDPALTKAFPNSDAVNEALRGLLTIATSAARSTARKRPAAASRRAGHRMMN